MQGSSCIEIEKENKSNKELVALYKRGNEKTIEKVFLTFAIYD